MSGELPTDFRTYRFERVLGHGGMGVVYAATDLNLRRRVAIKRVLTGGTDPIRRERLRREARTAAQLTHPAIVQIYDLVEEDGSDWIVMELVEGTLLHQLSGSNLGFEQVSSIGRQIAEGLVAAHALGIVHRDLKTENVALLPDGRIKILDFGLAKQLTAGGEETTVDDLSRTGQVLGTGRAMSPEQARGLQVGPKSDLFSLGVLLYEISTGVSPFRGKTLFDTLTRIATHHPPVLAELEPSWPRPFSDLVSRLLEKAPEQRPASARDVVAELSRIADQRSTRAVDSADTLDPVAKVSRDEPVSSDPPTPPVSSMLTVPRLRPKVSSLLGLGTAGVALVVGLVAVLPRDAPPRPTAARPAEPTSAQPLEEPLRLYEEGMRAVRRNDRPESLEHAIGIFQRLLDADPTSAPAHAGLARAYWEKARNVAAGGDPVFLEWASREAQEAVELNPYLADAHVSLGLARIRSGELEGADRSLRAAVELEPGNADAFFAVGKLAEARGENEAAEGAYRRAFELLPTPLYANALGTSLFRAGRFEEAESWFSASLDLSPENLHALRNLGGLYYSQGRIEEAAQRFQQALVLGPDASLYSNLGTIFFSRGQYSRAVAAFEDALAIPGATHKWIYWLNLADAYRQVDGREAEALEAYQRAIHLLDAEVATAPDNLRAASRRALAMTRAGQIEPARAELDRLHGSAPSADLYTRLRLAIADELCGNRQRALTGLEEALNLGLPPSEIDNEPDLQTLRSESNLRRLFPGAEMESGG